MEPTASKKQADKKKGFSNYPQEKQPQKLEEGGWTIVKGRTRRPQNHQIKPKYPTDSSQSDSQLHEQIKLQRKEESKYEIKTRYPYTRWELAQELRIPPEIDQPVFNAEQCEQIIKDHLDEMEQYEYDFVYSSKKEFEFEDHIRERRRKVKIRLYCEDCDKRWTSIVGTIQVSFCLQSIKSGELVNFRVRIYGMQCKDCNQMAEAFIYQSQLNTVSKIFCLALAEIFEDIEFIPPKDDRYKMKEEIHHHLEQLCEACQIGKCFARPKPKPK